MDRGFIAVFRVLHNVTGNRDKLNVASPFLCKLSLLLSSVSCRCSLVFFDSRGLIISSIVSLNIGDGSIWKWKEKVCFFFFF